MAIEQSGVPRFGLKSYAWFDPSMIEHHNCTTLSSIAINTILLDILRSQNSVGTTILLIQ